MIVVVTGTVTVDVATVVCHSTPVRMEVVSVLCVTPVRVVVGFVGVYVVGVMMDSEDDEDQGGKDEDEEYGGSEEEDDHGYGGKDEEDGTVLELETPVPYG